MTQRCSIIAYHFVRELPLTRFPGIKGLLVSEFKQQLEHLEKNYHVVSYKDCLEAIYSGGKLPAKAVLLTFDDGYLDNYTNVFPLLHEKKIQGCFFPTAKAILKNEVLDVNKIHFVLAAVSDFDDLLKEFYKLLDEHRSSFSLKGNNEYFSQWAKAGRYDTKEVVFIKKMLQRGLADEPRSLILNKLFKKYVTKDEASFSRELYMDGEQVKCMVRSGMYVGSHGYDHLWLDSLPEEEQVKDVDLSLEFLENVGAPTKDWAFCSPYGSYNDSLINIVRSKGCKLGLTIKVGIAQLNKDNALTLERLNANDLKKEIGAL